MKILIVGATGQLGSQIALELSRNPNVNLRAVVRDQKSAPSQKLLALNIDLIQGDLSDASAITIATRGIDCVVSAVQGGPEVILEGQLLLLKAAEHNGVKKMIPSDYAVPFKDLTTEQHPFLGLRAEFHRRSLGTKVHLVSVQQGAFMDILLPPFRGPVNFDTKKIQSYGTGDEPLNMTSILDTAKFTAQAALDPNAPRDLPLAGEVTSWNKIAADFTAVYGEAFKFESQGTLADLETWIADKKKTTRNVMEYVFKQYEWAMLRPESRVAGLLNARYSEVKPQSLREFLTAARGRT